MFRPPRISQTERQALEAGTAWIERDLFRGSISWKTLANESYPQLTERERAFLDGPCEEVCRLVDPWLAQTEARIESAALDLMKRERFFGLTLAEEHGGRGFSALAATAVFGKLASHSMPLSILVLIPNSVGPGELIEKHGTSDQKASYLPRLARGEEIPAFALTEVEAGSDAAALTASGRVFRDESSDLKIELNWSKRYITLAPVATILGLAVRLQDPQEALGLGPEPGITCVLVHTHLRGVTIGRRHDPMGVAFPNGPTEGRSVVVPISSIIGGEAGAGRGWPMLMEALAAGRGLSLPGQSAGGMKAVARSLTAYAAVRRQFSRPIARFEGVSEKIASVLIRTYLSDAARVFVAGAVMNEQRPSVVSAIAKHEQTEMARDVVRDAMDVLGGAALCRGPRNPFFMALEGSSIQITVEGANILTRTLIVFGQGVLRGHPHALADLRALERGGLTLPLRLARHAAFTVMTLIRLALAEVSRGFLLAPGFGAEASIRRRATWVALRFAALADLTLILAGPKLKQKGHLSGRLADALAALFLVLAATRRRMADGTGSLDGLANAAREWALARAANAVDEAVRGFDLPVAGPLVRGPIAWWCRLVSPASPPSDATLDALTAQFGEPGPARDALTQGIFAGRPQDAARRLDDAMAAVSAARDIEERIQEALRAGSISLADALDSARDPDVQAALLREIITPQEAVLARHARALARDVIQVDDFDSGERFSNLRPVWR
jgi:acyl-CoA dehydrogenase